MAIGHGPGPGPGPRWDCFVGHQLTQDIVGYMGNVGPVCYSAHQALLDQPDLQYSLCTF